MARRYYYEGVRETQRLFRRLPGAATDEMAGVMKRYGPKFLAAQRGNAPVRTGRLIAGLAVRFLRRTLRLRVGYIGKAINRKLFYGHIIQFGRKAQTVTVKRRKGTNRPYALRVGPLAARPFVHGTRRVAAIRTQLYQDLQKFWGNVLAKASRGGFDG